MKTITKISISLLTFSWIGFLITTIHFMKATELLTSDPMNSLWLGIPIVIGLASSFTSIMWMQNPDVWKSVEELQNVRKIYKRNAYYDTIFIKALKKELLERNLPLEDIKKRAENLEMEEYGENGYQDA